MPRTRTPGDMLMTSVNDTCCGWHWLANAIPISVPIKVNALQLAIVANSMDTDDNVLIHPSSLLSLTGPSLVDAAFVG